MKRVAVVLWSGSTGGTETFIVELSRVLPELGVSPTVVFLTHDEPLGVRLDAAGIRRVALRLPRGSAILRHPDRLRRAVAAAGPDGALLPSAGYLSLVLRLAGYRGTIVVPAHDATTPVAGLRSRVKHAIARLLDARTVDVSVAVSDFALARANTSSVGRRVRIYNGVDLERCAAVPRDGSAPVTIAAAGRLVRGKGMDVLIQAFARDVAGTGARLRIAGDGAERPQLDRLARELGVDHALELVGWVDDICRFWADCDIAVVPSDGLAESFGMTAVEAMACMRPVVVSASGALPELVEDDLTGIVVPPGDPAALSRALAALAADPDRRRAMGIAGRARCVERFDIRSTARAYLELFA